MMTTVARCVASGLQNVGASLRKRSSALICSDYAWQMFDTIITLMDMLMYNEAALSAAPCPRSSSATPAPVNERGYEASSC